MVFGGGHAIKSRMAGLDFLNPRRPHRGGAVTETHAPRCGVIGAAALVEGVAVQQEGVVFAIERPQTCRFAPRPQGLERAPSWPSGMRKLGSGPAFSHEQIDRLVAVKPQNSIHAYHRGTNPVALMMRAQL
jgi:hypothetical protein